MHLTTDTPSATFTGQHIVLSFPSGTETVSIAIDSHSQAQHLACEILQASQEAFERKHQSNARAKIIPFQKDRYASESEAHAD